MLQENILKEAPHLNKKQSQAIKGLAVEFCVVHGEFSNL